MRTAIDADRNAQSGYIAEDEQTKPEMFGAADHSAHFFRFEIKGEEHRGDRRAHLATPAVAFVLVKLLNPRPIGANAYIFAAQYRRLVNPVSVAVALLAAVTLPAVVMLVVR